MRMSFDEVAGAYEVGRPSYPAQLVDDIVDLSGVARPRILEVGAGTGKATRLFAERGLEVVGIEPGSGMAALARRSCDDYPTAAVVVSTFEDWSLESGAFDLVVSAQAWHWVNPEIGYAKAHQALRGGGGLALFWSHPVWEESEYRKPLADLYDAYGPELAAAGCGPWFPAFCGDRVQRPSEQRRREHFGAWVERRYRWSLDYPTRMFLDLLVSLPEHDLVPWVRREVLFRGVEEVIEAAGGSLHLNFDTKLYFANRRQ